MLRKRLRNATLLTVLALFGVGLHADPPPDKAAPTVLRAARLLDVRTGKVMTNPVVLLENGRIAAVGSGLAIPKGARVLDLGGAMLLPGLIDAHTHLCVDENPSQTDVASLPGMVARMSTADRALLGAAKARELLAAGFTTVRDAGNAGQNGDVSLRDAIANKWVPGPRLFVASRGIAPIGGQFVALQPAMHAMIDFEYATITGTTEARRAVRQANFDRADYVKAYSMERLAPEELQAVCEEAHRLKMKVAAHATNDPMIRLALAAGVDSIEHGYGAENATLQIMAAKGVFLVPTIYATEFWNEILSHRPSPEGERRILLEKYTMMATSRIDTLRRAVKLGVPIAAGSDMVFSLPGRTRGEASLLILRAYLEAGMSPLQILQAATVNGADLIGPKAPCGALEKGLYADILAVSGDPLKDITELERIKFVMKEGTVIRNDLK